jgi:hypothetical protein
MPSSNLRSDFFAPTARFVAVGAFVGAAFLAGPLPAAAQTAWSSHHHHANAEAKRETVEERITGLHAALKITADEESNWAGVAQSMRENEANMQKLVADRTAEAPNSNAVRDLRTYERFAQAHANGLKNLISSFETLYQAMPDTQKVLADQVFQKYGGRGA